MKLHALLTLLASSIVASASVSELVGTSPESLAVLEKKCIQAGTGGELALPFEGVVEMLGQSNLFTRAQSTYADMLPEGKQPTVAVTQLGDNRYHTVNKKGQGTDITEVYRNSLTADTIDSVYHVKARRFFGLFEAVIHVQGEKLSSETTTYSVDVYAYPHNRLVRGITRQLHLVQRFFNKKTDHITNVLTTLGKELLQPADIT
jgi:hypothetical protein